MKTTVRSMRIALLCALAACSADPPSTQTITGRFDAARDAIAIRAVSGDDIVSAAQVRRDGAFTLNVPAGDDYRLEVLTRTGIKHVVVPASGGFRELVFKVCEPVAPYDLGEVGPPTYECTDPTDPNCQPPSPCTDPMDPSCQPPPPCSDPTDPNCPPPCPPDDPACGCDPMTGCPPPPCEPGSPDCPGCDPATDPSCPPPPCMDPYDPTCGCQADGSCPPPPPCEPGSPDCPGCDPATDPSCPPPPCMDPNDPTCGCQADGSCPPAPCSDPMDPGCVDPCTIDPASCGCTMEDPNCWPTPEPCCDQDGMCEPDDGVVPARAPTELGCNG